MLTESLPELIDTAPTPTRFAKSVGDDFPVLHFSFPSPGFTAQPTG